MKHLIVIIDGTWVSAADNNHDFSNAYSLNWLLDNRARDGADQIVFYTSGIGTDRLANKWLGGATGRGIDNQVREAYVNICSNFKRSDGAGKSDKLYLFGFSRGAIAIRALAGLIAQCGILRPAAMNQFPDVWHAYVDGTKLETGVAGMTHQNVEIEMVGLFDCVFGSRNRSNMFHKLQFKNLRVADRVKAAVHLLSLDDRRRAFRPLRWERNDKGGVLEQIWLPGVHSDIGGTYPVRGLGNVALMTMMDRIAAYTELAFDDESVEIYRKSDSRGEINDEREGWEKMLRLFDRGRVISAGHCQYLHPFVRDLRDWGTIRYKGRNGNYMQAATYARGCEELAVFSGFHRPDHDWPRYAGLRRGR